MERLRMLVLSCSLNPASRSAHLARRGVRALEARGAEVEFIDLRERELPLCDGSGACEHELVKPLAKSVREADAVLLALPVYNYAANAAVKNLIELTGRAWTDKLVGFVCAAGGPGSYMSVMSLANSLMLDFRCLIVPRFVYATKDAVERSGTLSEPTAQRIEALSDDLMRLGSALRHARAAASPAGRSLG